MDRPLEPFHPRRAKIAGTMVVAIAGFATAALIGVAGAKTFTLAAASNAKVVDANTGASRAESIATSRGFAVYHLTGDSSRHPECTKANGCFRIWQPVTVSSSNIRTPASTRCPKSTATSTSAAARTAPTSARSSR